MNNKRSRQTVICGSLLTVLAFLPASPVGARAMGPDGHKHDHGEHCDHAGTLVDIARKNGQFNTFTAAVAQAGLEESLSHETLTIFAPTDDAFAKLQADALEALLKPENKEKLKAVLLNHVVKGEVPSSAATSEPAALQTLAGGKVSVSKRDDGKVAVNAATVVAADVDASNGVIHGIDAVLLP
jgi:uncharacterized surface protein with fasciclin (FAS1) repeats